MKKFTCVLALIVYLAVSFAPCSASLAQPYPIPKPQVKITYHTDRHLGRGSSIVPATSNWVYLTIWMLIGGRWHGRCFYR